MDSPETFNDRVKKADAEEQIRELREQVEALMRDRVTPAVADAIGRAGETVQEVRDFVTDKTDALAAKVREKPLTAMLVCLGVGYLVGRITR